MNRYIFFLLVVIISCSSSCIKENKEVIRSPNEKKYIFLGHIYDWNGMGKRIDPRVEKINFNNYDQIWLGGDICSATTKESSTLDYLDEELQISEKNTLWAVGNHDIRDGNFEWIESKTKRPLYYAQNSNGITTLVLNTVVYHELFKDSCSYREGQLEMINNVLDTINESSHLVLLMHNDLWSNVEDDMNGNLAANANFTWMNLECGAGSRFNEVIYPRLKALQKKGIKVVVISGDSGQYYKKFEYTSADGIKFFMSGINNSHKGETPDYSPRPFNKSPDSILVFTHNLLHQSLTGEFVRL